MSKPKAIIPGFNFLERHTNLERFLDLDENHIIVDKKDYEILMDYLFSHSEAIIEISKSEKMGILIGN